MLHVVAHFAQARNKMKLGYTDPATGEFKVASSVQLRNIVRVNSDEATRKAAFEVSQWLELTQGQSAEVCGPIT